MKIIRSIKRGSYISEYIEDLLPVKITGNIYRVFYISENNWKYPQRILHR